MKYLNIFFLIFFVNYAFGQGFTITGKVVDETGESLPGASVIVRGTSIGTTTDAGGSFTLANVTEDAILQVTFVGYANQTVTVGDRRFFEISMGSDNTFDELIVVGYGMQRKETVVGAVTSVRGDEMLRSPASNLSHAVVGRMSGVVTYQRSGEPGWDGATIRIRGVNSFGDTAPLIVIDGIADRAGGIERLDPNEIESISVLKDGAAAIYGARAANGVILVTTKRGASQKPMVTFSSNFGIDRPTMLPPMSNAVEYMTLRNEVLFNDALTKDNRNPTVTPLFSEARMEQHRSGEDLWRYPDTDWYKETFRAWAPRYSHNLTLTGGTDRVNYFSTLSLRQEENNFRDGYGGLDVYNLRTNIDAQVNDYVKFGFGLTGRQQNFKRSSQSPGDLLWFTSRGRPTDIAFWPNGLPGPAQEYGRNPVMGASRATGYFHQNSYFIQSNANIELSQPWIKGLRLKGQVSYDKFLQREKQWEEPWYLYVWDGIAVDADNIPILTPTLSAVSTMDPKLWERTRDQTNMTAGAYLYYDTSFEAHTLNLLLGTERETADRNYYEAYRRHFISTNIHLLTVGANDAEQRATAGTNHQAENYIRSRMNYFGRVGYNYMEKYLFEFLWRYDGSYMFPKENRYGFFPGVLLGYRISEEDFWKDNLSGITYFKIRASWSQVGNDNIFFDDARQEYQFLPTYRYSWGMVIDGKDERGVEVSRFPNKNITWEVANMGNIGIEGRVLNNRLSFELDVFRNYRRNILWRRNASIPQTAGLTLPAENIGESLNRGFDFTLGWHDRKGDFYYDVRLTGGFAKDKIMFWDEAAGVPDYQRSTGKRINGPLLYEYDGVFKDWAEIEDRANRPVYFGQATEDAMKPGDMKFKNHNPDNNTINGDSRIRFDRNAIPMWNTGLNINLRYKQFDATILFQGAFDSWTRIYSEAGEIGNWTKYSYNNRWTYDNPSSVHPRTHARLNYYWDNTSQAGNNTYWMRRTDYVRLKNLDIGYTLPHSLMLRSGFFTSARVYVNGQNLLTFTKIDRDPESTSAAGTNYPHLLVLNAGFTVTF
jgi:TonB-linked SusC/RagA family outer membrane protein